LPKERYSTLCKLLRVTSYVLRFIANLRTKVAGTEPNLSRLSLEEITEAKHIWYKHIQGAIQTSKSFKQVQASLGLFKDNCGIWRCGGRLSNANIELSAKHPVFLPNDHWFSTLLVEECHRRVMHNGVRETLCEIRSEHWIAKGRQFVEKIIAKCTTCKRYEGGTYQIPPQPSLPDFRVSDDFAFTRVGVYFAGPVYAKPIFSKGTNHLFLRRISVYLRVPRHEHYISNWFQIYLQRHLFAVYRALFMSRRGIPKMFISDNGKTFKANELAEFATRITSVGNSTLREPLGGEDFLKD
jgi:hypothetical protein